MSIKNAIELLQELQEDIIMIDRLFNESKTKKERTVKLDRAIKHFLGDVNSALDYCAFEVFTRKCEHLIDPAKLESYQRKVYFFMQSDPKRLNQNIDIVFIDLKTSAPDLDLIFQYPLSQNWFKYLFSLSSHNRHRMFSPLLEEEDGMITVNLAEKGRIMKIPTNLKHIFENVRYGNEEEGYSDIKYDSVKKEVVSSNPLITSEVTEWSEFSFAELNNIPIMTVINEIYQGAERVIREIELIMK